MEENYQLDRDLDINNVDPFLNPFILDPDDGGPEITSISDKAAAEYVTWEIPEFNYAVDTLNSRMPDVSQESSQIDPLLMARVTPKEPNYSELASPIEVNFSNYREYKRASLHPAFSRLGFDPLVDTDEYYNANTSISGDLQRWSGQFTKGFGSGFVSSYRSIGNLLTTGKLVAGDYVGSKAIEDANYYGSITRKGNLLEGGIKNIANVGLIASETLGTIGSIAVESVALTTIGGLVGSSAGPGGTLVGAGAGLTTSLVRGGTRLFGIATKIPRVFKSLNTAQKLVNTLGRVKNARTFYNGVRSGKYAMNAAKYAHSQLFPSATAALKRINTLTAAGKFQKANALKAGIFADYAFDTKMTFNAINASQQLYVNAYQNTRQKGLDDLYSKKNPEDITDEDLQNLESMALKAGAATFYFGMALNFVSDKIVLGSLLKGRHKILSEIFDNDNSSFTSRIVRIKDLVKEGGVEKNLYVDLGKRSLLPFKDIKALGLSRWAGRSGVGILRYVASNLSEGVEEVLEDSIVSGVTGYYTSILQDPNVNKFKQLRIGFDEAQKAAFSKQGLDNFTMGFFVGSYINTGKAAFDMLNHQYFKTFKPEEYKKYKQRRENFIKKVNEIGDSFQTEPGKLVSSEIERFSNVNNAANDVQDALLRNDEFDFEDAMLDLRVADAMFIVENNLTDFYVTQLEDLLNLTDDELQAYVNQDPTANDVATIKKNIQVRVEQLKAFQKANDDYKRIVPNVYNPSEFKPGTEEFKKEYYKWKAIEIGRTLFTISAETFRDSLVRLEQLEGKIESKLQELYGDSYDPSRQLGTEDFILLTNRAAHRASVKTLGDEIEALELVEEPTEDQKETLKKKKAKKKDLETLYSFLEEYVETQYTNPTEISDAYEKLKEAAHNLIAGSIGEDAVKNTPNVRMRAAAADLVGFLVSRKILDRRSKVYDNVVQMFRSEADFNSLFDKLYSAQAELGRKRNEIFQKAIEGVELTKRQEALMKAFLSFGVMPDAAEIEEFVKNDDTDLLKTFWKGKQKIEEGSPEWQLIQEIIKNYNNQKEIINEETETVDDDAEVVIDDNDIVIDDDPSIDDPSVEGQLKKDFIDFLNKFQPKTNATHSYMQKILRVLYARYVASNVAKGKKSLSYKKWFGNFKEGGAKPFLALFSELDDYIQSFSGANLSHVSDFKKFQNHLAGKYETGDLQDLVNMGLDKEVLTLGSQSRKGVDVEVSKDGFFKIVEGSIVDSNGDERKFWRIYYNDPQSSPIYGLIVPPDPTKPDDKKEISDIVFSDKNAAISMMESLSNFRASNPDTFKPTLKGSVLSTYDIVINSQGEEFYFISKGPGGVSLLPNKDGVLLKNENLVSVALDDFNNNYYPIDEAPGSVTPASITTDNKTAKTSASFLKTISPRLEDSSGKYDRESSLTFQNVVSLVFGEFAPAALVGKMSLVVTRNSNRTSKPLSGGKGYKDNPAVNYDNYEYFVELKVNDDAFAQRLQELALKSGISLPNGFNDPASDNYRTVGFIKNGVFSFNKAEGVKAPYSSLGDAFVSQHVLKNGASVEDFNKEMRKQGYLSSELGKIFANIPPEDNRPVEIPLDQLGISINSNPGSYDYTRGNEEGASVDELHYSEYSYNGKSFRVVIVNTPVYDDNTNSTSLIQDVRVQDLNGNLTSADENAIKTQVLNQMRSAINNGNLNVTNRYVLVTNTGGTPTFIQLKQNELTSDKVDAYVDLLNNPNGKSVRDLNQELRESLYVASSLRGYEIVPRINLKGELEVRIFKYGKNNKLSVVTTATVKPSNGSKFTKDDLLNAINLANANLSSPGSNISFRESFAKDAEVQTITDNTKTVVRKRVRKGSIEFEIDQNKLEAFDLASYEKSQPSTPAPASGTSSSPTSFTIQPERFDPANAYLFRDEGITPIHNKLKILLDRNLDFLNNYPVELRAQVLAYLLRQNAVTALSVYSSRDSIKSQYPQHASIVEEAFGVLIGHDYKTSGVSSYDFVNSIIDNSKFGTPPTPPPTPPTGPGTPPTPPAGSGGTPGSGIPPTPGTGTPKGSTMSDKRKREQAKLEAKRKRAQANRQKRDDLEKEIVDEVEVIFQNVGGEIDAKKIDEIFSSNAGKSIVKKIKERITLKEGEPSGKRAEVQLALDAHKDLLFRLSKKITAASSQSPNVIFAKIKNRSKKIKGLVNELKRQSNNSVYKLSEGDPVSAVENLSNFLDWVSENLPDFITVEQRQTIIKKAENGVDVLGMFEYNLRRLGGGLEVEGTILTIPNNRVAFHEAFHGVFRLLLTTDEQVKYLNQAKKEMKADPNFDYNKRLDNFKKVHPRSESLSEKELENLFIEEYLADKFAEFKVNPRDTKTHYSIKSLFNRFINWIKALVGIRDYNSLRLFRDIDAGKYRSATVKENMFTAEDSKSVNIEAYKLLGYESEIRDGIEYTQYIEPSTAEMLIKIAADQFIQRKNKTFEDYQNGIIDEMLDDDDIYDLIISDLLDTYTPLEKDLDEGKISQETYDRMENVAKVFKHNDGEDLKAAVEEYIDLFETQIAAEESLQDERTDNLGTRGDNEYGKSADELSGPSSLTKEFRMWMANTYLDSKDMFGNTETSIDGFPIRIPIDFDYAYSGLMKAASDTFTDYDMLVKMYHFSRRSPHARAVFDKFTEEVGINMEWVIANKQIPATVKNPALYQYFVKNAFRNSRVEYDIQYQISGGAIISITTSERDNIESQKTYWQQVHTDKIESYKSNPKQLEEAQDSLLAASNLFNSTVAILNTPFLKENLDQVQETDNRIINNANVIVESIMEATGIQLSTNYIVASMIHAAKKIDPDLELTPYTETFANLSDSFSPFDVEQMNKLYTAMFRTVIVNNKPQFKIVNLFRKDEGELGMLTEIALSNAMFDETVGFSVFKDASGKNIYPHQNQTYHIRKINEMNDPDYVDQSASDPFLKNNNLIKNPFFKVMSKLGLIKHTRNIGKGVSSNIKEGFDQKTDFISSNSKKGAKDFTDYTTTEFLISLVNDYFGYFNSKKSQPLPVIEDENGNRTTYVPTSIRIMESASRTDRVNLPVTAMVYVKRGKNKKGEEIQSLAFTDQGFDLMLNQIEAEYDRVKNNLRELEQVKSGQKDTFDEPIVNYNVNKKGEPLESGNAFKFYKTESMMPVPIMEKLLQFAREGKNFNTLSQTDASKIRRHLLDQFANWYKSEFEPIYQNNPTSFNQLLSSEIAEDYFLDVPTKEEVDRKTEIHNLLNLDPEGNVFANMAQIYFDDWVRTMAVNELILGEEAKLFKDQTIDPIKRGKMQNAAFPNTEISVIAPELGIEHTLGDGDIVAVTIDDDVFEETFRSNRQDQEPTSGERMDAQIFVLPKTFRYFSHGIGVLTKALAKLIDIVESGDEVNPDDFFGKDGFLDKKAVMNSKKYVYGDGKTFLKFSLATLSASEDSRMEGNSRVTLPGSKIKRNVRESLERLQAKYPNKVVMLVPASASKMMKTKIIDHRILFYNQRDLTEDDVTFLDAKSMGLQMVNPSNKTEGTVPNQQKMLLPAEQDPSVIVNGTAISDLIAEYHKLVGSNVFREYAERVGLVGESFQDLDANIIRNIIDDVNAGDIEMDSNLVQFLEYGLNNLKAAKASLSDMEFFKNEGGAPKYPLNNTLAMKEYEKFMMIYLSKKAMFEKTKMLSLTLKSDTFETVVRKVYSVDANGEIDKQQVIRKKSYSESEHGPITIDIEEIRQGSGSSSEVDRILKERVKEALKNNPNGVIIVDRLRVNLPEYTNTDAPVSQWKATGNIYAESIVPPHFKSVYDWAQKNPNKIIPDFISKMFAVRIPSQDKHSSIATKVVDFGELHQGSTVVFPYELIQIAGSDFDIDKVYAQIKDFWVKLQGDDIKFRVYGEGANPKKRYEDYIHYQLLQLGKKGSNIYEAYSKVEKSDSIPDMSDISDITNFQNGNHGPQAKLNKLRIALKTLGLPISFQEYKDYVSKNGVEPYKGAIDNRVLDIRFDLQANEGINKSKDPSKDPIGYQPADTGALERVAEYMRLMFGRVRKIVDTTGISIDNLAGKAFSHRNVKENHRSIGTPVSFNTALSILKETGQTISSKFIKKMGSIEFNGKAYSNFAANETEVDGNVRGSKPVFKAGSGKDFGIKLELLDRNDQLDPDKIQVTFENSGQVMTLTELFNQNPTEYNKFWKNYLLDNPELLAALTEFGHAGYFQDSYNPNLKVSENIAKALNEIAGENKLPPVGSSRTERTQYLISNNITAATDDAKLRLLSQLGLSKYSLKLGTVLIGLGVPLKSIILFLNSRSVTKVVNLIKEDGLSATKAIREVSKELGTSSITNIQITDDNMVVSALYLNEDMGNIPDSENLRALEIKLLEQLERIDKISTYVGKIVTLTNMTRGLGNGFTDLNRIRNAISDLGLDKPKTGINKVLYYDGKPAPFDLRDVFNYNSSEISNSKHWLGYYLKIFKHFTRAVLPNLFTVKTRNFERLIDNSRKFLDLTDSSEYLYSRDLLSYLAINVYRNNLRRAGRHDLLASLSNDFIYGDPDSAFTIKSVIETLKDYYDGQDNYFLDRFASLRRFVPDENNNRNQYQEGSFFTFTSNTFHQMSPNERIRVQNSFAEILRNPDTRSLGVHIIHYMIVKDGFQFAYQTLLRGMPVEVFQPLLQAYEDVFEAMKIDSRKPANSSEVFAEMDKLLGGNKNYKRFIIGFNKNYPVTGNSKAFVSFVSNYTFEKGEPKRIAGVKYKSYDEVYSDSNKTLTFKVSKNSLREGEYQEFPIFVKKSIHNPVTNTTTYVTYKLVGLDSNNSLSEAYFKGSVKSSVAVYQKVDTTRGHFRQTGIGFMFSRDFETRFEDDRKVSPELNSYVLERFEDAQIIEDEFGAGVGTIDDASMFGQGLSDFKGNPAGGEGLPDVVDFTGEEEVTSEEELDINDSGLNEFLEGISSGGTNPVNNPDDQARNLFKFQLGVQTAVEVPTKTGNLIIDTVDKGVNLWKEFKKLGFSFEDFEKYLRDCGSLLPF